jgi:small-conductance mechanosensitive channel
MERRRITFMLGVVYDTPLEKLRRIPAILSEIITTQEGATLDHVHFLSYGEYNLKFEVIYFIESAEYNRFAEIQEEINLKIFKQFSDNNIRFAYPTQTIITAGESPQ